jgi:hypothetical protein
LAGNSAVPPYIDFSGTGWHHAAMDAGFRPDDGSRGQLKVFG